MIATAMSARIGRGVARTLHSSKLGYVLGPIFRTEAHAVTTARHEFGQLRASGIGTFDAAAALDAFRAQLEELGGWETAAPFV